MERRGREGAIAPPDFGRVNTFYLTDLYIIFTLKMESVSKNTTFGLNIIVKSGLEKIYEIPPCGRLFFLTSKKCPKSQIQ